ncbi:hypothetical protein Egran_03264 [Elaphomyces granulatus]|uniref:MIF4G domain-containing protein n=1 Tax=Elaphomyces granulatus TaxID=519963 RepID=A0A232LXT1_9EURO|nr:hypothetical protein Egran_03264 [Elaphomyces granulatus]
MSSLSQRQSGFQPQGQSINSPATSQAHLSSPSLGGKSSSFVPPVPAPSSAARSYAHATKRSTESDFPGAPVTVGGPFQTAHHGKVPSIPVNGKPSMQQPQLSGVTIVNGAPAQGDHGRKPSVTISSAGTTGYMPNGAPAGGPPNRPNSIQFGALNQQGSPAMGSPALLAGQPQSGLGVAPPSNPRITSPQTSPSPIPQPASSGGRPPSTFPSHGISFGESGDVNVNDVSRITQRQYRHTPQAPLGPGPQPSHLRRESAQSAHGEMGGHMAGGHSSTGRGGYAGRGRGYSQPGYQGQLPYSSSPNYRGNPNQPRGGPNMGPQYHGHNQGRPLGPYNSPHQATRSPALANAHPVTPQMNQVPMAHPQMSQLYGPYNQHMGPQTVRHQSPSKPYSRHPLPKRLKGTRFSSSAPYPYSFCLPLPNLAPESGQFEEYLKLIKHQNFHHHGPYDPNYYYSPSYQMPYMTPSSPQPRPGIPYNQPAPYHLTNNQFPPAVQPPTQPPQMSRSPSQVSERPGSSLSQGHPPPSAPTPGHTHNASRSSNSPAPVPKAQFVKPTRGTAIVIKNPSGEVMSFDKQPPSPARATPSPVKGLAPTPPLRTNSGADQPRFDRKPAKTDEEKKKEFQEAVRLRPRAEVAEQQMNVDEEEEEEEEEEEDEDEAEEAARVEDLSLKENEEVAADPAAKAVEDTDSEQPSETVSESSAAVESGIIRSIQPSSFQTAEGEDTVTTLEMPMELPSDKARVEPASTADDELDFDAIQREIEERERLDAAREAEYERKKQAEKEERARKEKEESEAWMRNMKAAEQEAEAKEEARLKKLEAGYDDAGKRDREEQFAALKRGTPASDSPAPGDSGADTPVSSDPPFSMGPPPVRPSGPKREKPAALKLETNKPVEPPQQTAAMKSLHSARFIQDPSKICYPLSIVSPSPALNANAPSDRKFKYNKEFLLQFQAVFKEKPSLDWDARVRETVGDAGESARPQSARTPMMGARNTSRPGIQQNFQMGSFGQAPNRQVTTSEQRFAISNAARAGTMGASPFGQFGRPTGMVAPPISRTSSSAALHSTVPQSPRVGSSSRGGTRTGSKRDKQSVKKDDDSNKSMPLTAGLEVKALTVSTSGWKPRSILQGAPVGPALGGEGHLTPDVVQRKVKSNLNKMTPENFDRISELILTIVSQSKDETDGRTLRQVIQLTFEKATDEAHWAPMYAKFCKRMLESMSPDIKDENIRDKSGNVVTGGSLFRKYLLNRCQEEFERGWKVNLPGRPEGVTEEVAMMSDEYYTAAAAKRRGLGLVKFIGELYKLGMLTERIMHECVKKLVDYEGVPDVAEVESLTSLLRTIGASLDSSDKGRLMMDAYFNRIHLMIDTAGLPSRLKFMLMDVADLRDANWRSKGGDKGPKTLAEVREEMLRQQHEQEMERLRQQANRGAGRVPMGRGDSRNFDYRNQAPPQDFASSKVGNDDLRRLKTTRNTNQPISFGPPSMFGGSRSSSRKTLGPGGNLVRGGDESGTSSRTGTPPAGKDKKEDKEAASSINAFSALASLEDRDNLATSPPSNPSSPPMAKTRLAIERRQSSKSPSKDGDAIA